MGSAIKMNVRSGGPRPIGAKRKRQHESPLDKAKGYEIDWQAVAPLFQAARPVGNCSFVYFIGEEDGPVKIGVSKDPIGRLRTMQTGNPRRLRIERVIIGFGFTEKLLHEIWAKHAIYSARTAGKLDSLPGTEWFEAEARAKLLPIAADIAKRQIEYLESLEGDDPVSEMELERILREVHGAHEFDVFRQDIVPVFLARTGVEGSVHRQSRL